MQTSSMAGVVGLVFLAGTVGCARINTQVVDKPRVDQDLPGNQGYLQGSAPAPGPRKATRRMIETNIELPTADELNPWRKRPQAAAPAPAAPAEPAGPDAWEEPTQYAEPEDLQPVPLPTVESVEYTVQSGDTLEKISKKFYGTTKKWRRIYDANRGVLRTPDRVYPGQKLMIPTEEEAEAQTGGQDFK